MLYNNMKILRKYGLCFLILLIASACATEPKKDIIKIEPPVKAEPVLALETLEGKISVLQNLLSNNKIQEKDVETISNLISDYQKIRDISQGDMPQGAYREMITILFRELCLFEEKYLSSQDQTEPDRYVKAIIDLNQKKQSIFKKYAAKDYKGVVSEYNEFENAFGKDSVIFEMETILAMSLSKVGKLSEAINIGDKIIAELEGIPDLFQLRSSIIEWRINTGKKEKAIKDYQKLVENMDEKQAIFEKITSKINSQNKKIADSDQILSQLLKKESNSDVNVRIANILKEVNNLETKGDFSGARLLLQKWKLSTDDQTETAAIENALKAIDVSEKQYQENLKTNRKEGIEAAAKLIDEEDYESAIKLLDLMKSAGDNNIEIDKQRNLAVEKLINNERNRAAKIFLTAKKTDDSKKKEELLTNAQNILNGLIEKYPSSDLAGKLKSNLESVNDELKKVKK
jgi:hypothetical protein